MVELDKYLLPAVMLIGAATILYTVLMVWQPLAPAAAITPEAQFCSFLKPVWGSLTCKESTSEKAVPVFKGMAESTESYTCYGDFGGFLERFYKTSAQSAEITLARQKQDQQTTIYTCNAARCVVSLPITEKVVGRVGEQNIKNYLTDNLLDKQNDCELKYQKAQCDSDYPEQNAVKKVVSAKVFRGSIDISQTTGSVNLGPGEQLTIKPAVYTVMTNAKGCKFCCGEPIWSPNAFEAASNKFITTEYSLTVTEYPLYIEADIPPHGVFSSSLLWGSDSCYLGVNTLREFTYLNLDNQIKSVSDITNIDNSQDPEVKYDEDEAWPEKKEGSYLREMEQLAIIAEWVQRPAFKNIVSYRGTDISFAPPEETGKLYLDALGGQVWSVFRADADAGCYYVPYAIKKRLSHWSNSMCSRDFGAGSFFDEYTLTCTTAKPCRSPAECGLGPTGQQCVNKQVTGATCDFTKTVSVDGEEFGLCKSTATAVECCLTGDCAAGKECRNYQCIETVIPKPDCPTEYECCATGETWKEKPCAAGFICVAHECIKECAPNEYWDEQTETCKELTATPTATVTPSPTVTPTVTPTPTPTPPPAMECPMLMTWSDKEGRCVTDWLIIAVIIIIVFAVIALIYEYGVSEGWWDAALWEPVIIKR